MKCLKNEKRETLEWKSSFEIYFSRKSNELIKVSLDIQDDTSCEEVYKLPAVLEIMWKGNSQIQEYWRKNYENPFKKNCYVAYNASNKVFVLHG